MELSSPPRLKLETTSMWLASGGPGVRGSWFGLGLLREARLALRMVKGSGLSSMCWALQAPIEPVLLSSKPLSEFD